MKNSGILAPAPVTSCIPLDVKHISSLNSSQSRPLHYQALKSLQTGLGHSILKNCKLSQTLLPSPFNKLCISYWEPQVTMYFYIFVNILVLLYQDTLQLQLNFLLYEDNSKICPRFNRWAVMFFSVFLCSLLCYFF